MTALFQSNDSVHEILMEAGLQRIHSDDMPLFRSVSSVTLPPLQPEDDGNASTSEEPLRGPMNYRSLSGGSERFYQSMLDILAMKPVATGSSDTPSRTMASSSPREHTSGQQRQGSPLMAADALVRSNSVSSGNDFMQNMLEILSSKPTAGRKTRSSSRTNKRALPVAELTSSKTWNNLGQYHDVDVENIFQTKQGDDGGVEEEKEKRSQPIKSGVSLPQLNFCEIAKNDVLLGRGGRSNNHHGNKRYLALKDSMQDRYLNSDKATKKALSQDLVHTVQEQWGGRFLKLDKSGRWYEVDNETARKKCSQSLREINTPEMRAAKRARYSR
mmetsp:Transcript_4928/g.10112  ORF Transcript_4928/g.10112 Transcript_4928/m.10112 type:complete len:329 (+) Transcript_4928:90-1076(+)|eukprot:scaffold7227_cov160-Amphora_coffeaeformis.AAC.11